MSASDKKKQKKAALAEGMTQQQRKEAEAAQKEKTKKTVYWAIGIVCAVAAVALLVWNNFGNLTASLNRSATAATVNGTNYTVSDLQYYYGQARQNTLYMNQYYYYAYGFSIYNYNSNIDDGAQWYSEANGKTYADYFREIGLSDLKETAAMCADAKANGYTLSEEGKASIDKALADIDVSRAQYGLSRSAYLAQVYGEGVTEKVFVRNLTNDTLASEYQTYHKDNLTYDEAALNAYYEEHADNLDSFTYRSFTISGTPETKTDSEGNTVAATDEEKEQAKQAAEESAKAAVEEIEAASNREKAFLIAAPKYVAESEKDAYADADHSLHSKIIGASLSSTDSYIASWLKDANRKAGDVTYVEAGSNYRVVLFLERALVNDPTVDMRHILIKPETSSDAETNASGAKVPTQEQMDAAKTEAQAILDQWKSGDATEDSFAALAEEKSDDGRNTSGGLNSPGGLYTYVSEGDMVPSINQWLFESGRKAGDTALLEYNEEDGRYYGWHVVYFVGDNAPYWQYLAAEYKRDEDQSEWRTSLTDAVELTEANGMQYVGSANTAVPTATATPAESTQPSESVEPEESTEPTPVAR